MAREVAPPGLAVFREADVADPERRRLLVTAVLSLPVLVLSVVPGAQFHSWQWLCFVLAAPGDAAALAEADLGIALGDSAEVAAADRRPI